MVVESGSADLDKPYVVGAGIKDQLLQPSGVQRLPTFNTAPSSTSKVLKGVPPSAGITANFFRKGPAW